MLITFLIIITIVAVIVAMVSIQKLKKQRLLYKRSEESMHKILQAFSDVKSAFVHFPTWLASPIKGILNNVIIQEDSEKACECTRQFAKDLPSMLYPELTQFQVCLESDFTRANDSWKRLKETLEGGYIPGNLLEDDAKVFRRKELMLAGMVLEGLKTHTKQVADHIHKGMHADRLKPVSVMQTDEGYITSIANKLVVSGKAFLDEDAGERLPELPECPEEGVVK